MTDIFTDINLLAVFVSRLKIKLSDEIGITNVGFRISVTIEAPFHRHRFNLRDDLHLVDPPVTGNATDTSIDVSAVIEIHKIRKIVNAFPKDGFIRFFQARPDRFQ